MKIEREENHKLKFTIEIDSYGKKSKRVKDVGGSLCKILYIAFGPKFRVFDHKNREMTYDPDAHDFGYGEA